MSEMQELMDFDAVPQTHSRDPQSSHDAETRMRKSGKMKRHAEHVLELVREWPNFTSRELSETRQCRLDLVEVRRRLTSLMNDGRIEQGPQRTCTVARTRAVVWKTLT